MLDNGSNRTCSATSTNPGAGDLLVDGGAAMKMGGFAGQDSLTLTAAAAANLTLVNTSGTNTLQRTSVNGYGHDRQRRRQHGRDRRLDDGQQRHA